MMAFDLEKYFEDLEARAPRVTPERQDEIRRRVFHQYGEQVESLHPPERPDPNVGRGPWCRQCGVEKGADNHWFECIGVGAEPLLLIQPLGDSRPAEAHPLCGEACVQAEVAQWCSRLTDGFPQAPE
jgi:hypothetical protein